MKTRSLAVTLKALLLLFLAVFITFFSILTAPFVIDDVTGILYNPELGDLGAAFSHPLLFSRPLLLFLSYTLGGVDPFAYHVVNVLFHLGTVFALYFLVKALISERYALITALLFAVHPLVVEPVTWISAVSYPQYTFLLIMSLLLYVYAHKYRQPRLRYVSIFFYVLSLLASEKAVVLPIILVTLEVSYFSLKKHWKDIIPYVITSLIFGGLLMLNIGPRVTAFNTDASYHFKFINPLYQIPFAVTSYLQLVFFPYALTIYHYDRPIGILEFWIRGFVLAALIALMFVLFKKNKNLFFWLSLFMISLLPTFIPFNIAWIVAERYAYLGTVGIIACIAYPLYRGSEQKRFKAAAFIAIGVLIVGCMTRSIIRTADWQDEDTLLIAASHATPWSARARNNVGGVYVRHKDYAHAIEEFKASLALEPNYPEIEYNLANCYYLTGNRDEAIKYYLLALKNNPRLWRSHTNLGKMYMMSTKEYQKAIPHLKESLKNDPSDTTVRELLKTAEEKNNE